MGKLWYMHTMKYYTEVKMKSTRKSTFIRLVKTHSGVKKAGCRTVPTLTTIYIKFINIQNNTIYCVLIYN